MEPAEPYFGRPLVCKCEPHSELAVAAGQTHHRQVLSDVCLRQEVHLSVSGRLDWDCDAEGE